MYNLYAHGEDIAYGVNKYITDTYNKDDENLWPKNVAPGSTMFVISDSTLWMLNSNKEWKKIETNNGGGGSADPAVLNWRTF